MEKGKFSYEMLYEVVAFLAKKKGATMEIYVDSIKKEIESERVMNAFLENFEKLSDDDQALMLHRLEKRRSELLKNTEAEKHSDVSGRFSLTCLVKKEVNELVKTKPIQLIIDNDCFEVNSWTDVSCRFVNYLVDKGDLRNMDLPLCPSERSQKAFVNSFGGQPEGVEAESNFIKVTDGFYVDSKYNAKYHLLNIWRTLKKLNIENKYEIIIVM